MDAYLVNRRKHLVQYLACKISTLWEIVYLALAEIDNTTWNFRLQKIGALEVNEVVKQHEAWRLASCMWLHEGVFHIIMNMVSLRFVGIRLEEEFGFGMSCTHFTSPKILDSKLSSIAYLAKLKSTFFEKYDMLNCFNHVAVWIGFCILCAFTQKKSIFWPFLVSWTRMWELW